MCKSNALILNCKNDQQRKRNDFFTQTGEKLFLKKGFSIIKIRPKNLNDYYETKGT